ncbi:hypothetical protein B0H14DRAFT_2831568 [Mycena olivaceomarginata]|nr:hypothetical protein B0H14DRAFT_2831568 [Mycena olivaceomarginata]
MVMHPQASDRQTANYYYIHGGIGGPGGEGHGQGTGGAGGPGTGPTLNFTLNNLGNVNHIQQRNSELGIHILRQAIAGNAFYNSAERYPQPKCHPETRTKILEDLRSWSLEKDPGSDILWLYGPAGAGKSAIAQSFCERLQMEGCLGASFFFKREHSSRGNGNTLFPTIAYQLSLCLPQMKHAISEIVEHDPSIIGLELSAQLQKLIIEPWQRIRITRAFSEIVKNNPSIIDLEVSTELHKLEEPWPWQRITHAMSEIAKNNPFILLLLITIDLELQEPIIEKVLIVVIDGLDECDGRVIQQAVLQSLGTIIVHEQTLPLRFVVASRPEPHIREIFMGPLKEIYRPLSITESFGDVWTYLQDEFARIHHEHHETMDAIPGPWPSAAVLAKLVEKSSGYFIYASTVIKFIDDKDFRPTDRLKIILGIKEPDFGSPYGALDQLYTQILSGVPARPQLVQVMHFISTKPFQLSIAQIEQLLDLEPGDFRLILRRLHSVIKMPSNDFDSAIFYHASFLDFLCDPTRSGIFYIHNQCTENLARHILKAFSYPNESAALNEKVHVAWALDLHTAFRYIASVRPSFDLVSQAHSFNMDFLFHSPRHYHDSGVINVLLNWLKKWHPLPKDVIQRWEDFQFLLSWDRTWLGIVGARSSDAFLESSRQQLVLQNSPQLIRILHAYRITRHLYALNAHTLLVRNAPLLLNIRLLLNLSWDELRAAICCIGSDRGNLRDLLVYTSDYPSFREHLDSMFLELAHGSLRILKKRLTRQLIPWKFNDCTRGFGHFLRSCPPSPDLLLDLCKIADAWTIHPIGRDYGADTFHDVVQWLKTFPKPPLEIRYFEHQLRISTRNSAHTFDSLEKRWKEWQEWHKRSTTVWQ